ncbi:WD40 repeat domain-containing protein [Fimbriiglobus ruber]|uniref:High-affnity carbon uptake protein Hat/HatR n=1 Tax=Fimbriiglobus ruber TaxID=1908690 RepID=A0A225D8Z2_9BACT|nr:hypothetical protein [Fimbriiglobus ruber]OWK37932.1 High-affnity carbon uptake protein Hat/HatR [Fimbriiglobus ruber]
MLLLDGHTSTVTALAFSPDGELLASGGRDGALYLHDGFGGRFPAIPPAGGTAVHNAAFAPNGRRLAVGLSNTWQVFEGTDGGGWQAAAGLTEPKETTAVGFLNDDTLLVGTGDRTRQVPGALELWTLSTRKRRNPRFPEGGGVRSIAAHPASKTLAWANGTRRVTVTMIEKPDKIEHNLAHTAASISFHPNGEFLAVSQEWGAKVLDLARRQERLHLKGHKGIVPCVAYSPDGRTLATGSWDGTVRFWDAGTGTETACFQWGIGKVFALAYSPDGLRVAAGGDRGTVMLWDVG